MKAINSAHNKASGRLSITSTSPKAVTILGSLPPIPALSSYCLEMALSMADLVEIEFISFKEIYPSFLYPGGDLQNDFTYPEINHPNLKKYQTLKWYNPLSWIWEGIRTRGDLLHAQWWSLPLAPIYLVIAILYSIRKKPVVFTIHNISPHEPSRLHGFICRVLFKWGDFFIVHAASNKEKLIKYFSIPPERVALIPHGPLNFHIPQKVDRDIARKNLGIQSKHKVVLFFGGIRTYKGLDVAIESFSQVIKEIPEARLLIAGKLWADWQPYVQLISDLGIKDHIISHLKYIPSNQVYRYFITADLVILPYRSFEAQSGVGALAVAFRKPLIVTNVGGLPELQDNKYFVVPPGDPVTLARRIVRCLEDPQKLEDMRKGTEAVADRINWTKIAERTLEIYQKVMMVNGRNHRSNGIY